jgi:hypothetical protein
LIASCHACHLCKFSEDPTVLGGAVP